jgi:hypothetical protein
LVGKGCLAKVAWLARRLVGKNLGWLARRLDCKKESTVHLNLPASSCIRGGWLSRTEGQKDRRTEGRERERERERENQDQHRTKAFDRTPVSEMINALCTPADPLSGLVDGDIDGDSDRSENCASFSKFALRFASSILISVAHFLCWILKGNCVRREGGSR